MDKLKRTKIENLVYDVFNALDPTGANTEFYRNKFTSMNDVKFDAFIKQLLSNPDNYLILDVTDYERDLKIENVEKAARVLGIPLYERLIMPHMSPDPRNPIVTKVPVPIIYVHKKRMQQMVNKKNSTSTEIAERNKFNQSSGHDKNGRSSDMENYSLVALGAKNILKEYLGPKADDSAMKTAMYSDIYEKGYCSLENLPNEITNKTTLNYIDACFLAMGLKTDLITKGSVLKQTIYK